MTLSGLALFMPSVFSKFNMGNNDGNNHQNKPVKVTDPLTRMLVGMLGTVGIGFGTWFANEVQKNAVNTSVLTQRVNTMEVQFPAQIRDLKNDIRGDITELKEMVRRLERKP